MASSCVSWSIAMLIPRLVTKENTLWRLVIERISRTFHVRNFRFNGVPISSELNNPYSIGRRFFLLWCDLVFGPKSGLDSSQAQASSGAEKNSTPDGVITRSLAGNNIE
ncbi:hypothetical protein NDU88_000482 [Pleurodeles waltl]|uniref:Uncharacterized protein n=1 Tax=Pleurodeles waltl TaxID=8319 RepID=A0AAV7KVR5_PLEWA|nr:hypothetical protein NDU88_000482 [Pleurodeles waltl]